MKGLNLYIIFFFITTVNLTFAQEGIKKGKYYHSLTLNDKPLIVINDSILKYEVMEFLNPNDIESITVWKDEKAMSLYGEKGKFGVIKITTKNLSKRKLRKIYKEFKNEF